jgi:hypothetical protein
MEYERQVNERKLDELCLVLKSAKKYRARFERVGSLRRKVNLLSWSRNCVEVLEFTNE